MFRPTAHRAIPPHDKLRLRVGLQHVVISCWFAFGWSSLAHAQLLAPPSAPTPAVNMPPGSLSTNRGWEGLANALDAITPSVNTDDKKSGDQIASEIEQLINQGRPKDAMTLIEARETALKRSAAPGQDVQLMFQKARALSALQQTAAAQAIYQDMTVRYPELPDPWNNLAIIYIQQGRFQQAEQALKTALMNNPANVETKANLEDVQLLMKLRHDRQAAQRKEPGALQQLHASDNQLRSH